MTRHSLASRILAALLLVSLLGLGSLLWHTYDTREELRYSTLLLQANEIAHGLTAESDLSQLPQQYAGGTLYYTLYDADGKAVWHSDNIRRPLRMRGGTLEEAAKPLQLSSYRGRGQIIGVPVILSDGATLIVSKQDNLERSLIDALLQTRLLHGLIALLPFCLITALIIWGLMRWTLRPVRQAAALASEISPDTPQRRIPLRHLPKEILPLAQAANLALDRLGQALVTQKQLVADAAHELRTPLTVLDLRLQKMQHEGNADWPAIEQEMQRLRRLVEQLLALARQDYALHQQPTSTAVSLSRLTRETIASLIPLFEQQGRPVEADIEDKIFVRGEADALRDAIRNLLENALQHGQGTVCIRLQRGSAGEVMLDISDEGKGIPLEAQDEYFQRFRKGRQGSAGSGLGLAIARQTLLNHGADIRFISTTPCVVRMYFPVTSENSQSATL